MSSVKGKEAIEGCRFGQVKRNRQKVQRTRLLSGKESVKPRLPALVGNASNHSTRPELPGKRVCMKLRHST